MEIRRRSITQSKLIISKPIVLFYLILSIMPAIGIQPSALAEERKGFESHLSIGMGWERLDYEEHETDSGTQSNAKVNNAVMGIEGLKRWESLFGGIKATIPVLQEQSDENWISSDQPRFQTNTIKYGWTRIDGYIGYPSTFFFNPYAGVRWSESRQDRRDFLVNNAAVAGTAKETIRSWNFLIGVSGHGYLTHQWRWNYRMDYVVPIDVKVSNSAIPGFEASDKNGYTLALQGGVAYAWSNRLSFGLQIFGGRMHWNGSDWQASPAGRVKWPENNTAYLGAMLMIDWH